MNTLLCLLLSLSTINIALANTAHVMQHSRYTSVSLAPLPTQQDLLAQLFEGTLPSHIETVGEALDYLLQHSGYQRIATPKAFADPSIDALLAKPLPLAHRTLGPIRLRDALAVMVKPFTLQEDSHTRTLYITLDAPQETLA
jgi:conjugative transfer region protein (TIGR03748 family)